MEAVVYVSNTGFTEKYARMFAAVAGVPALPEKEARRKLARNAQIVFMGWIFAEHISGLSAAKKRWELLAVAGVGMSAPSPEVEKELRAANSLPEKTPLFYLQGGVAPDRLRGVKRWMFGMAMKEADRQERAKGADAGKPSVSKALTEGRSFVSAHNLEPMIAWYAMEKAMSAVRGAEGREDDAMAGVLAAMAERLPRDAEDEGNADRRG